MKKYLALFIGMVIAFSASADRMIEDFEDGSEGTTNQTTLGESLSYYESETDQYFTGYWYAFTDEEDGGASVISTEGVDDVVADDEEFEYVVVEDNGVDGTMGLYVTMTLTETANCEYPYAAVGFSFTETDEYHDLCGLESITFDAKGAGDIRVKIMTYAVTEGYDAGENWGDMGKNIEGLTSSWDTYTIAAADIAPQEHSPQADANLTWNDACDQANKMHFQSSPDMGDGDVIELYLDNIYYNGTEPATWDTSNHVSYKGNSSDVASGIDMNAVFSPNTENVAIDFDGIEGNDASLGIYNSAGQLVKSVSDLNTGSFNWNTSEVTSGMYVCRLKTGNRTIQKSVSVVK